MSNDHLSTQEMLTTLNVFATCQQHLFAQLGEEGKYKVQQWIEKKVLCVIPCFSLRPDALEITNDQIFKDVDIRDFCLALTFRFFTLCCEGEQFVHRLAGSMAQGLSCDGELPKWSTVPEVIKVSMPESIMDHIRSGANRLAGSKELTVTSFLESNKHLLVVYLLHLTSVNGARAE